MARQQPHSSKELSRQLEPLATQLRAFTDTLAGGRSLPPVQQLVPLAGEIATLVVYTLNCAGDRPADHRHCRCHGHRGAGSAPARPCRRPGDTAPSPPLATAVQPQRHPASVTGGRVGCRGVADPTTADRSCCMQRLTRRLRDRRRHAHHGCQ